MGVKRDKYHTRKRVNARKWRKSHSRGKKVYRKVGPKYQWVPKKK